MDSLNINVAVHPFLIDYIQQSNKDTQSLIAELQNCAIIKAKIIRQSAKFNYITVINLQQDDLPSFDIKYDTSKQIIPHRNHNLYILYTNIVPKDSLPKLLHIKSVQSILNLI